MVNKILKRTLTNGHVHSFIIYISFLRIKISKSTVVSKLDSVKNEEGSQVGQLARSAKAVHTHLFFYIWTYQVLTSVNVKLDLIISNRIQSGLIYYFLVSGVYQIQAVAWFIVCGTIINKTSCVVISPFLEIEGYLLAYELIFFVIVF